MKTIRTALAFLVISAAVPLLSAQNQPASNAQLATQPATVSSLPSQSAAPITEYRLTPDLHEKAHRRNRIHFGLNLIGTAYGVVVLWLILRWRLAPRYRNWAERISDLSFLQSVVFSRRCS
jgi:hypothetical protein